MDRKKYILLLVFLISLLIILNYNFLDGALEKFLVTETGVVERVIDGDTVKINNESVRLLGINCPERGEDYYEEAKEFLEKVILDKEVELKFGKDIYDRYDRKLAYLFYKGKNVNLELVDEGLANVYILGKSEYESELRNAWKNCFENLCEESKDKCANCIELKTFDYSEEILVFYNQCNFDCELTNWEIKDEGRKKFIFPEFVLKKKDEVIIEVGEGIDNEERLFWTGQKYVWTNTGDTLFLRDSEGKLVLWESY
jgi:micrococcal nuclease